jgi:medium-chain acyl-[acyl-carrier-protein] hydrolase
MMGKSAEKEYEIHYYEVDYKRRVLLTSMMNYFNDICTEQSDRLGISIDYMKENNISWIIYKWDIDIERYPVYGEKVKVRTEPYSFRKFYAYRKFEIEDEAGSVIVSARTVWFLIDAVRRKPLRVPAVMYEAFGISPEKSDALETRKISAPEETGTVKEFSVRYSDIDTNMHVNNVNYAAWVLETVPMEIVLNYTLKKISLVYEKETLYGETIKVCTKSETQGEEVVCSHKILDGDGKVLNIAETRWG